MIITILSFHPRWPIFIFGFSGLVADDSGRNAFEVSSNRVWCEIIAFLPSDTHIPYVVIMVQPENHGNVPNHTLHVSIK